MVVETDLESESNTKYKILEVQCTKYMYFFILLMLPIS